MIVFLPCARFLAVRRSATVLFFRTGGLVVVSSIDGAGRLLLGGPALLAVPLAAEVFRVFLVLIGELGQGSMMGYLLKMEC